MLHASQNKRGSKNFHPEPQHKQIESRNRGFTELKGTFPKVNRNKSFDNQKKDIKWPKRHTPNRNLTKLADRQSIHYTTTTRKTEPNF